TLMVRALGRDSKGAAGRHAARQRRALAMAFKILTGTYDAGYTLSPTFSVLSIASTGVVGGAGVLASA
ncbi:MAG: hypothetical protein ABI906_08670, partial [Pseudomonadota bacterium]